MLAELGGIESRSQQEYPPKDSPIGGVPDTDDFERDMKAISALMRALESRHRLNQGGLVDRVACLFQSVLPPSIDGRLDQSIKQYRGCQRHRQCEACAPNGLRQHYPSKKEVADIQRV